MPAFYQIGPVQNNAAQARPCAERERIFHTRRRRGKILPRRASAVKVPGKYCPQRQSSAEVVRRSARMRPPSRPAAWGLPSKQRGAQASAQRICGIRGRKKRLSRPSLSLTSAWLCRRRHRRPPGIGRTKPPSRLRHSRRASPIVKSARHRSHGRRRALTRIRGAMR